MVDITRLYRHFLFVPNRVEMLDFERTEKKPFQWIKERTEGLVSLVVIGLAIKNDCL